MNQHEANLFVEYMADQVWTKWLPTAYQKTQWSDLIQKYDKETLKPILDTHSEKFPREPRLKEFRAAAGATRRPVEGPKESRWIETFHLEIEGVNGPITFADSWHLRTDDMPFGRAQVLGQKCQTLYGHLNPVVVYGDIYESEIE